MSKRVDLVIIDGQNDFCASGNEPDNWPTPFGGKRAGSLYVAGADKEAVKVAEMIGRVGRKIQHFHASLDSHHHMDGSHNIAWEDQNGNVAPPFTIISHDDVIKRKWLPRFAVASWEGKTIPSELWARLYTERLAAEGRCPLCLWPPHCVIQSWGASVYWPLQEAYDKWCMENKTWINFITKGQSPFTEHYSALRADVPDPALEYTQLNIRFLQEADKATRIIWCGWAGSHCTRWTALDAVNYFGQGRNSFLEKSVFLTDATAAVANIPGGPDFGQWRQEFLDEVKQRGAALATTDDLTL